MYVLHKVSSLRIPLAEYGQAAVGCKSSSSQSSSTRYPFRDGMTLQKDTWRCQEGARESISLNNKPCKYRLCGDSGICNAVLLTKDDVAEAQTPAMCCQANMPRAPTLGESPRPSQVSRTAQISHLSCLQARWRDVERTRTSHDLNHPTA